MKAKIFALILLVGLSGILSHDLSALSINDILSKAYQTNEVQSVLIDLESAKREITLLSYPGNATLNTQNTSKTGEGYTSLSGYVYLSIPTGPNSKARENLNKAYNNLNLAQTKLRETLNGTILKLFTLYENTWLAQQEIEVLLEELKAYEALFNITREKYKAGTASLSELTKAEENYSEATENLLQGRLRERLAWLEMAYATGKTDSPNTGFGTNPGATEILEKYIPESKAIPKPPELTIFAYNNLSVIKAQEIKIREIEAEIARINSITSDDLQIDIKGFFNYGQHSAFADYNFLNPTLNIGYSFPITTIGETLDNTQSSVTSSSIWNAGVTLSLGVKLGNTESLERAYLEELLKKEKARLTSLRNSVALDIRSKYQRWLNTQDYIKQAERNLKRAIDNLNIAKTKTKIGIANEAELREAEALVKRAQWNLYKMQIESEKARLNAYLAAGKLPDEYKDFIKTTKKEK